MKKLCIAILSALTGAVIGAGVVERTSTKKEKELQSTSDKHLALFLLMNQWVKLKQEGKNLADYFEKNNCRRIAVYGMSYVGETLVDELKGTGITVAYGIDKNASFLYDDVDVISMDTIFMKDDLEEVDAIVVTAVTFFDEIEEILSSKVDCSVLSLEDVLYEV